MQTRFTHKNRDSLRRRKFDSSQSFWRRRQQTKQKNALAACAKVGMVCNRIARSHSQPRPEAAAEAAADGSGGGVAFFRLALTSRGANPMACEWRANWPAIRRLFGDALACWSRARSGRTFDFHTHKAQSARRKVMLAVGCLAADKRRVSRALAYAKAAWSSTRARVQAGKRAARVQAGGRSDGR